MQQTSRLYRCGTIERSDTESDSRPGGPEISPVPSFVEPESLFPCVQEPITFTPGFFKTRFNVIVTSFTLGSATKHCIAHFSAILFVLQALLLSFSLVSSS
jgi:hypothetical protein